VLPDPTDWRIRRSRGLWRRAARPAHRVTTVIFDLGGVVLASLFESVAAANFPRGPLADDPEYAAVEVGAEAERDYWDRVARRDGWDVGDLWRRCSRVRPVVAEAIATILPHMPVFAFTNDLEHWFGAEWRARFPELLRLDGVIEASKLGLSKPAPAAFRAALDIIGEPAQHCMFVDDLQANLDGAQSVGMPTCLFDLRHPDESVRALLGQLALPWRRPGSVFVPKEPSRVAAERVVERIAP